MTFDMICCFDMCFEDFDTSFFWKAVYIYVRVYYIYYILQNYIYIYNLFYLYIDWLIHSFGDKVEQVFKCIQLKNDTENWKKMNESINKTSENEDSSWGISIVCLIDLFIRLFLCKTRMVQNVNHVAMNWSEYKQNIFCSKKRK